MKKLKLFVALLICAAFLAGCSTNDAMFKMDIRISPPDSSSKKESVITASMKKAIITKESWVLFEVRSSQYKGSIWLRGEYEGEGVYSVETDELPATDYVLISHYYAGGGFHISRRYEPQV